MSPHGEIAIPTFILQTRDRQDVKIGAMAARSALDGAEREAAHEVALDQHAEDDRGNQ
jgi:hypothetical protein